MQLVTIYENGRIMLPASIRKRLNIKAGDLMTFFINYDAIIICKVSKVHTVITALPI